MGGGVTIWCRGSYGLGLRVSEVCALKLWI